MDLKSFRNILRVLWAAAGFVFIYVDVRYLGNTDVAPSFWIIMGVLVIAAPLTGLAGGVGAALIAQGALKYRQCTYIVLGKLVFAPGFSTLDKAANAVFIAYGIFAVYMQVRKNIRGTKAAKTL